MKKYRWNENRIKRNKKKTLQLLQQRVTLIPCHKIHQALILFIATINYVMIIIFCEGFGTGIFIDVIQNHLEFDLKIPKDSKYDSRDSSPCL